MAQGTEPHAHLPARQVTSPLPALAGNSPATWPNSPFVPHQQGVGHIPLSVAGVLPGVMSPEFARVPIPEQGRWLVHVIPLLGSGLIDWAGFWANSEPMHAWIAAVPLTLGTAGVLGSVAAAVATAMPGKSATEHRDSSATRMVAGGGVALLSLGAMMGAGVTGTGCVGAVATVAGSYVAWAGFIGHRRKGNQQVVIEVARAAAAQPLLFAPQPPPGQAYLPGPTNPYEARVLSALESMGHPGATAGPPKAIGEDAWQIRVALPKGRNASPDKLVAQAEVLASNMEARRVEIATSGSNIITITAFDGPDTLGPDYLYRWDGAVIESLDDPMAIAMDEAGRILEIVFNDHLLISGKTGGGKSKLVRLILARTLGARVVRFGIDCKPGAVELGMFEPVMHMLAKNSLDGVRMHHGLKAMIAERGLILEENNADEWRPEFGPQFIVASDERAVITRDYPDYAGLIEENIQMMRFVGGRTADATQTPSGGVYGNKTDARHQYGIRIGFYNESTVNTMVFGGKASSDGWRLEKLENAPGKFLIRSYGHNVPRPYKSLWAERAEIIELVERYAGETVVLDERSAVAFSNGIAEFDAQQQNGDVPSPGGGRRTRKADPIEAAQDFHYSRPRLVRTFPDGSAMNEARAVLWDALGEFPDGFAYRDVVALDLPGYARRSSLQEPLDQWRARGWVTELRKVGNTTVYVRCAHDDDTRRKEA